MKLHYQSLIGVLSFILFGCSPKYYVPNTQNVPIINARGKVNLTVAGNANQVELQGAVGITKKFALQANGGFVVPKNESNGNGGSGKFIEAGLGYYKNIGPFFLFDTYGLIGLGEMENHFPTTVSTYPLTTGKISANMLQVGLQPSISFHMNYFSISGSAKIGSLNYSKIVGSFIFDTVDQINYLNDHKSNVMVEPALTVRAGLTKIKLQIQLIKSFNLSTSNFKQDNTLLSVGLNFRI